MDERGEGGGLVATAGVVEEVAGEGGAPVPEDLHEAPLLNQRLERFFDGGADTDPLQHRLDDEVRVVEGYRSLRVDGEGFTALFELPSVEGIAETEADAGVVF